MTTRAARLAAAQATMTRIFAQIYIQDDTTPIQLAIGIELGIDNIEDFAGLTLEDVEKLVYTPTGGAETNVPKKWKLMTHQIIWWADYNKDKRADRATN
jgi:hypothetical protein